MPRDETAAHNALEARKKKSGKAKRKCLKKAKTHNARLTVEPPPPAEPCTGQPPGAPCGPCLSQGATCFPGSSVSDVRCSGIRLGNSETAGRVDQINAQLMPGS
jgi:hypothetical protein